MLNTLIAQKKCQTRYPELGSCPLDILKKLKPIPSENLSNDALVSFYFEAVTTNDCERKLEYLNTNGFDLFVKNSAGKSVADLLDARIKENRYPKNRHGSLLQIEDKKMLSNTVFFCKAFRHDHTGTKHIPGCFHEKSSCKRFPEERFKQNCIVK